MGGATPGDGSVLPGAVVVRRAGAWVDLGYSLIASGYLVVDDRVLLVFHNRFRRWVPPGGHIEPGETFARTAAREFREETGIEVDVLSALPSAFGGDDNATPEPVPFHVDVEREGFLTPALVQFFYVRPTGSAEAVPQLAEVDDVKWFTAEDLVVLDTFDQVRHLATAALVNHPDAR